MEYLCMCFGWFQELLREERVPNFAAAEAKVAEMLDGGGMIVHAYRESNTDQPEIVGRNRTFQSFMAVSGNAQSGHEIERYLLDASLVHAWRQAVQRGGLLENRWQVMDVAGDPHPENEPVFGRATRLHGSASRYGLRSA
jgi:hypothetical protein